MFNDYGHCDGCGHLYCICETGPAPKEEGMPRDLEQENIQLRMRIDELLGAITELTDAVDNSGARSRATARAIAERAYFAALAGNSAAYDGQQSNSDVVGRSYNDALETVRQWPAFMAEVDKIAKSEVVS